MHSFIEMAHMLDITHQYAQLERRCLSGMTFPIELIKKVLQLVTCSNVLDFGNTTWDPKMVQAMGMPMACIIAVIHFIFHKNTIPVPPYQAIIIDQ